LIIESNVSSELAQNLTEMLHNYGIYYCEIREKYNTAVKETRIVDQSYNILKRLYFPKQENVSIQTDIGLFMNELTTYNTNGRNEHDDATDSCAFFTREIVERFSMKATISIFKRPF
jgi:adenosine deaminase